MTPIAMASYAKCVMRHALRDPVSASSAQNSSPANSAHQKYSGVTACRAAKSTLDATEAAANAAAVPKPQLVKAAATMGRRAPRNSASSLTPAPSAMSAIPGPGVLVSSGNRLRRSRSRISTSAGMFRSQPYSAAAREASSGSVQAADKASGGGASRAGSSGAAEGKARCRSQAATNVTARENADEPARNSTGADDGGAGEVAAAATQALLSEVVRSRCTFAEASRGGAAFSRGSLLSSFDTGRRFENDTTAQR